MITRVYTQPARTRVQWAFAQNESQKSPWRNNSDNCTDGVKEFFLWQLVGFQVQRFLVRISLSQINCWSLMSDAQCERHLLFDPPPDKNSEGRQNFSRRNATADQYRRKRPDKRTYWLWLFVICTCLCLTRSRGSVKDRTIFTWSPNSGKKLLCKRGFLCQSARHAKANKRCLHNTKGQSQINIFCRFVIQLKLVEPWWPLLRLQSEKKQSRRNKVKLALLSIGFGLILQHITSIHQNSKSGIVNVNSSFNLNMSFEFFCVFDNLKFFFYLQHSMKWIRETGKQRKNNVSAEEAFQFCFKWPWLLETLQNELIHWVFRYISGQKYIHVVVPQLLTLVLPSHS